MKVVEKGGQAPSNGAMNSLFSPDPHESSEHVVYIPLAKQERPSALRPDRLVWIGMLELTCGRLDGSWITGTERKHFRIFFPFHASITIGMGVIFLITNKVNKQIIPQTKV